MEDGTRGIPAGASSKPDIAGLMMRVRRLADLSQRDLGRRIGISQPQIARIESAQRSVDVGTFAAILAVAGLRIAVVDESGAEVDPVPADLVRDHAHRRMPAHLDVRFPDDRPSRLGHDTRYDRPQPPAWFHHRAERDRLRLRRGADEHDDQPTASDIVRRRIERDLDRREAARRRARFEPHAGWATCTCPVECWETAGCVDDCTCRCEAG